MEAYAYMLQGSPDTLETHTRALGEPLTHWVANAAELTMGEGVPADWREQGAVFGPTGELRWWKVGDGYRVLLLADRAIGGLDPMPGEWTAEEQRVYLQNLNDQRLNPRFRAYPHGSTAGRFRARVFLCDGVPMFVSPRVLEGVNHAQAERN